MKYLFFDTKNPILVPINGTLAVKTACGKRYLFVGDVPVCDIISDKDAANLIPEIAHYLNTNDVFRITM